MEAISRVVFTKEDGLVPRITINETIPLFSGTRHIKVRFGVGTTYIDDFLSIINTGTDTLAFVGVLDLFSGSTTTDTQNKTVLSNKNEPNTNCEIDYYIEQSRVGFWTNLRVDLSLYNGFNNFTDVDLFAEIIQF